MPPAHTLALPHLQTESYSVRGPSHDFLGSLPCAQGCSWPVIPTSDTQASTPAWFNLAAISLHQGLPPPV